MTEFGYIDLSGNRLTQLSEAFTTKLDRQFNVQHFEVNTKTASLMYNCDTVKSVSWIRKKHVILSDKDRLMCIYRNCDVVLISSVYLDELEAECDVNILPIALSITVGIVILFAAVVLVRYHRWYIKYHLVLCCMKDAGQAYRHDANVHYFMQAASPKDQ